MPKPTRSIRGRVPQGVKEFTLGTLQEVLTIAHREDYSPDSIVKIEGNFRQGIKAITVSDVPEEGNDG